MAKCAKCNKLVSKKNSGLQCSKCNKWLHAICASISPEQLSTLVGTDSIDWKCRGCVGAGRPKRLSAILPEAEEEEVLTDTEPLGLPNELRNQILADIRREIREIIRDELQRSLKFYSDKIDDFQEKIDDCEDKIQTITHQHNDINNKYKNINLKYEATEQRINLLEQNLMVNKLEICDIPRKENENLQEFVTKIAAKINQKPNDVINIYRKGSRSTSTQKSHPSLVVTLRDGLREQWLEAARSNTVTTSDLGLEGESRVYLREALTPATAHLLWKAKTDLKMTNKFKYVWCKRGAVLIKKDDGEKAIAIKSIQDLEKWSRDRE